MKRLLLVLAIAATLVAMLAVPAFANAENPNANCIGQFASSPGIHLVGEEAKVRPPANEGSPESIAYYVTHCPTP